MLIKAKEVSAAAREDFVFLQQIASFVKSESGGKTDVPVIVLINQVDELSPETVRDPSKFESNARKKKNIDEAVGVVKRHLEEWTPELKVLEILPIAACIVWSEAEPSSPEKDRIVEDEILYNIDRLLELLIANTDVKTHLNLVNSSRIGTLQELN